MLHVVMVIRNLTISAQQYGGMWEAYRDYTLYIIVDILYIEHVIVATHGLLASSGPSLKSTPITDQRRFED